MPGRTTARGYGYTHQQQREQWRPAVEAGRIDCARCGQPIAPGTPWDLGHTDDRRAYQGPEHQHCNRRAGQQAGQAMRRPQRVTKRRGSRDW